MTRHTLGDGECGVVGRSMCTRHVVVNRRADGGHTSWR